MVFSSGSERASLGRSYRKLRLGVLAIPALFYFLGSALLLYSINRLIETLRIDAQQFTQYDLGEIVMSIFYFNWAILMFFGFTASAMVSSYILLKYIREHFYYSALEVYSLKSGVQPDSAVKLVDSFLLRSNLPSPITGLLLAFLTAGLSYPVILSFSDKSVREHMATEEELVLGTRSTRLKSSAWIALDIFLFFVTFGIYCVYMSWRITKIMNNHLELVHLQYLEHGSQQPAIEPVNPPATLLLGLHLLALSFAIILLHIGVPGHFVAAVSGIGLSCIPLALRGKKFLYSVVLLFIMVYTCVIAGVLGGISAFEQYSFLFEHTREAIKWMRGNSVELSVNVFLNNFALSAPSAIPAFGGLALAYGSFNAGFILGLGIASGVLPLESVLVLIYPHAVLEILAYAVLASSSMYYTELRMFARTFVFGTSLLFLAAVVETITIELASLP